MNELTYSLKHGKASDPEVWSNLLAEARFAFVNHHVIVDIDMRSLEQVFVTPNGMLTIPNETLKKHGSENGILPIGQCDVRGCLKGGSVGQWMSSDNSSMLINWRPPECPMCHNQLKERRRKTGVHLKCPSCAYEMRFRSIVNW